MLAVGLVVAVISTYRLSVTGLMNQVGLVGADFGAAINRSKLNRDVAEAKSFFTCNVANRIKGTLEMLLGGDRQQAELAFKLGEARITCGEAMMYEGKAENGTYEIIKGMGYYSKGYQFITERTAADRTVCKGMPDNSMDFRVSGILEATNGKIFEIIWKEWQDVKALRAEAQRECIDSRQ